MQLFQKQSPNSRQRKEKPEATSLFNQMGTSMRIQNPQIFWINSQFTLTKEKIYYKGKDILNTYMLHTLVFTEPSLELKP